jgi:hypothetical protein
MSVTAGYGEPVRAARRSRSDNVDPERTGFSVDPRRASQGIGAFARAASE